VTERPDLPTFLVVTGAMRSGTTLLAELLHPFESRKPRHPELAFDDDRTDGVRALSAHLRRAMQPPLPGADPWAAIEAPAPVVAAYLRTQGDVLPDGDVWPGVARVLLREIRAVVSGAGSEHVVGVKTTHLMTELDLLRRAFPRVRMVVMLRDPRDVLASNLMRIAATHSVAVAENVLLALLGYHYFLLARQDDRDLLVVRYEELVADPRRIMADVLGFAGLDAARYDWASLDRGQVASNTSYQRSYGEAMIPDLGVVGGSVGRFRDHLSAFHVYCVERLLAPLMERFGYPCGGEARPGFAAAFGELFVQRLRRSAAELGTSVAALERRLGEMGCKT
jgi:hypothetical protein